MTVNELIKKLQALKPNERELDCRAYDVEVVYVRGEAPVRLDEARWLRGEGAYYVKDGEAPLKYAYVHIHGA